MSIEVSPTQSGTPFNLKFCFEPRSRLFGLIIGINKYQSDGIPDLQGCKLDAQSIVDLLSQKLHIRSSHFLCLADERATRRAIIDGFEHHLIENENIEHGDVMIIYYAGHGSRPTAPKGWVADDNKVETICPHDERTLDCNGEEIFGIPDRTICGLLRKLCKFKGDKIVRMTCYFTSSLLD
jgi:Caspase domain